MIRKAEQKDYVIVAKLAKELWNNHSLVDLENEFKEYLFSDNVCIYLDYENNVPVAFSQVSLRYEYVEGVNSSPVAYLEGIFVKEEYRNQNIAQQLIIQSENWAKEKGCKEIASDCELENEISYRFHLKNGFKEVNKIICFTKQL
ncbi:MAG: GNAT family N-acetyltransferase [bacterium]|nr:GNAT family N-acetyltransferase [bacterium]